MQYQGNEGIQCLRELVFYNELNLLKTCIEHDQADRGCIAYQHFATAFVNSSIKLPARYQEQIWRDAPKTQSNELRYRELSQEIQRLGMPTSVYSICMCVPQNPSRLEDLKSILQPRGCVFDSVRQADLANFGLDKVDLTFAIRACTLEEGQMDEKLFDLHNTRVMLRNFEIRVCKAILQAAIGDKTGQPESVKMELVFRLFKMRTAEKFRNLLG